MRTWLRRLLGVPDAPPPPSRRMADVLLRLDDLEADVTGLRSRFKKLQGLVTGAIRRDETPEDAPQATNDPGQVPLPFPKSEAVPGTEHLAKRFRYGG